MEQFKKYLRSLPKNLRLSLEREIGAILEGKIDHMDIRPLKGMKGFFRVRKGVFRIIFHKDETGIDLVKVEKRSDTTYDF